MLRRIWRYSTPFDPAKVAASLGYSVVQYSLFRRNAWIVLLLYCLIYCVLYGGRMNLALIQGLIEQEFHWSKAELGLLASLLFWTYGVGQLVNGRLGELFGIKRFIVAGALLSSLANIAISFQSSFLTIALLWACNGYFQSMLWAPGVALLASWWPGASRGFAVGLANASSALGQVITWFLVLFGFYLLPAIGWRSAFIVPVLGVIVAALLFACFAKQSPSQLGLADFTEATDRQAHEDTLRDLLASQSCWYPFVHLLKQWRFLIWGLIVAGANTARYGLLTWIPLYYKEVMSMDIQSGLMDTIWLPLGMALGSFLVPVLSEKYFPHNRLIAVIVCSLLSGASVFIFPLLSDPLSVAIVLFLVGFFVFAITGMVWVYALDIGGRVFAGTASGVLGFAAYMGAGAQALIYGKILDSNSWDTLFIINGTICVLIALGGGIACLGNPKKYLSGVCND